MSPQEWARSVMVPFLAKPKRKRTRMLPLSAAAAKRNSGATAAEAALATAADVVTDKPGKRRSNSVNRKRSKQVTVALPEVTSKEGNKLDDTMDEVLPERRRKRTDKKVNVEAPKSRRRRRRSKKIKSKTETSEMETKKEDSTHVKRSKTRRKRKSKTVKLEVSEVIKPKKTGTSKKSGRDGGVTKARRQRMKSSSATNTRKTIKPKPTRAGVVVIDGTSAAVAYGGDMLAAVARAVEYYEQRSVQAFAVVPHGCWVNGKVVAAPPGATTRHVALREAARRGGDLLCNGDLEDDLRRQKGRAGRRKMRRFLERHWIPFTFIAGQLLPNPHPRRLLESVHAPRQQVEKKNKAKQIFDGIRGK